MSVCNLRLGRSGGHIGHRHELNIHKCEVGVKQQPCGIDEHQVRAGHGVDAGAAVEGHRHIGQRIGVNIITGEESLVGVVTNIRVEVLAGGECHRFAFLLTHNPCVGHVLTDALHPYVVVVASHVDGQRIVRGAIAISIESLSHQPILDDICLQACRRCQGLGLCASDGKCVVVVFIII